MLLAPGQAYTPVGDSIVSTMRITRTDGTPALWETVVLDADRQTIPRLTYAQVDQAEAMALHDELVALLAARPVPLARRVRRFLTGR